MMALGARSGRPTVGFAGVRGDGAGVGDEGGPGVGAGGGDRGGGEAGVDAGDEVELPGAAPFFQALFAKDGGLHRFVEFAPDEEMHAVAASESPYAVGAILLDARGDVGRDADVQGASFATGEDVDAGQAVAHGLGSWFEASVARNRAIDYRETTFRRPRESGDPC